MDHEPNLQEIQKEWHGSYKSYFIGFVLCLALTCVAFGAVVMNWFPKWPMIHLLVSLALVQALTQLVYFLHVGQEASPKWETLAFCFMLFILLIITMGSLLIMYDLDTRVMEM